MFTFFFFLFYFLYVESSWRWKWNKQNLSCPFKKYPFLCIVYIPTEFIRYLILWSVSSFWRFILIYIIFFPPEWRLYCWASSACTSRNLKLNLINFSPLIINKWHFFSADTFIFFQTSQYEEFMKTFLIDVIVMMLDEQKYAWVNKKMNWRIMCCLLGTFACFRLRANFGLR